MSDSKVQFKLFNKTVWIEYFILNLFVLMGLTFTLQLWNADIFSYPIYSGGDVPQVLYIIEQMKEIGLSGYSTRVGYPYYVYMSDFPSQGIIWKFFRWILVIIIGDAVTTVNLIFIVGFFLVATTSYVVLKKLKISKCISGLVALLYTFLPYHFMRGIGHLAFSSYWPIPFFAYYCISYMKGVPGYTKNSRSWLSKDNIIHIITLVLMGGHCVYYTYFSCFFICMIIMFLVIRRENRARIKELFFDLAIILCTFSCTVIPYVADVMKYGANDSVANRTPGEIEYFGTKIGQLILPVTGHRLSFLADLKLKYNRLPLTTENSMATLGVLFTIGFFVLLIELVKKKHLDEDIYVCALLNFGALLLSTIGGFASVIALYFTKIRCYNRISIFIAFFSAISFAKFIERYLCRLNIRAVYWGICVLLLSIGFLDQTTPAFIPAYNKTAARWNSDKEFIRNIEELEGAGAKIYQMPYMTYPEASVTGMESYDHVMGYLHSNTLIWSYGCYAGRVGDFWNKYISALPFDEQLKKIYLNGFDGIYIDSNAYSENEFNNMLKTCEEITGVSPIISTNKRLYYFTLKNYSGDEMNEYEKMLSKIFFNFSKGFTAEGNGSDIYVCDRGSGIISIYNYSNENAKITVSMGISTLGEKGTYKINVDMNNEKFMEYQIEAAKNQLVAFPVELKPGENAIKLTSEISCDTTDTDELAFLINNFSIDKDYLKEIDCESGIEFDFGEGGNSSELYITQGICPPEQTWSWTLGNMLEMYCNFGESKLIHATIDTEWVINEQQKVIIYVDKEEVFNKNVQLGENLEFDFLSKNGGITEIQIMLPDAVSPASLGQSKDERVLGVAIRKVKFTLSNRM